MKWLTLLLMLTLPPRVLIAKSGEEQYYQRLYYSCKIWGYARYFHQNLGTDHVNWDEVLLSTLPLVRNASTEEEFNQVMISMLEQAGELEEPFGPLPEVIPSLRRNIDLEWFRDPPIQPELSALLERTRDHFRPREHWLLEPSPYGLAIAFERDSAFHGMEGDPAEEIRLLGLFRYWNIINYFFAYKDIMDQHWDSTLVEFIPAFVRAGDALSYNLAFRRLTTRINDSHGLFNSPVYDELTGTCHPPFLARNIEGKLVVTRVLPETENLGPGDIILEIDDQKVEVLLDSIRKYTAGSNPSVIEFYAHRTLLWGKEGEFRVLVDHGNRTASHTFSRNGGNMDLLNAPGPYIWWDKLLQNGQKVRVVDMARLPPEKVDELFDYQSRYAAYIFDIREKPLGAINVMVDKLFEERIRHVNAMVPDPDFPGTYYWHLGEVGQGTSKPSRGKVVMLFNENTRSHSEYTCMILEVFPGALKVGCQTAGADGNVGWVLAPCGIRTAFTNIGIFYPDGSPTQRVGITPHIEVRPSIEGIRAGRDEVLTEAFKALGGTAVDGHRPEAFHFYPNPAGKEIYYCFPPGFCGSNNIILRDISGRTIRSFHSLPASGTLPLECTGPGIYLLEIPGQCIKRLVIN